MWKKYGINWFSLDAPRHLHIQTTYSMEILSKKTGFELENIVFDSSANQFGGNEQYKHDIFFDSKSYLVDSNKSLFSKKQINQYNKLSKLLNEKKQGDSLFSI